MKALMLSIDATVADSESHSFHRIKEQAGLVDELNILVLKKGKEYRILKNNLSVWSSPRPGRLFSTLWAYNKGRDLIGGRGVEVVTAQDPFFTGILARKLAHKFGIGYEIQVHGDFFSNKYWKKESWLNKFLFNIGLKNIRQAGSVRVVGRRIKNDLVKRGIDENKIIVAPIYVDWSGLRSQEPKFSLKEKYPQFDFIALFLARLEKVKNTDLLIHAWKESIKNNSKAGLIIVGGGSEEQRLKQIVKESGLEENIIFEPATRDVVSYYRGADCFVLTSYYEGWGRTVIEAMACECPVIMTDVGCAGEAVKDGESGIVIPIGNKEALLEALKKIKNDPGLRQRLAARAIESLRSLPDQEETKNLYIKSWEKAIKTDKIHL